MDIDALALGAYAAVLADVPTIQIMDNPLSLPSPPSFVLYDFTITPDTTMRFASEAMLTFRVVVGRADPESAAKMTRGLASDDPGSIFYALMKPHILGTPGGQTFGGACDDAIVTTVRGYRQYVYAGGSFIGFEVVVKAVGERAS